jgi:hypothetical protein
MSKDYDETEMDISQAAALKLTEDEKKEFRLALEHYRIHNGPHYLYVCFKLLVEHYKAGDSLALPLHFARVVKEGNGFGETKDDPKEFLPPAQ